jgi:hypothetical protein
MAVYSFSYLKATLEASSSESKIVSANLVNDRLFKKPFKVEFLLKLKILGELGGFLLYLICSFF